MSSATNAGRKSSKAAKPMSSLGETAFNLETTHQPQLPQTAEGGRFDIKQFLMEQKVTQSFHDGALFRSSSSSSHLATADPAFPHRLAKKKQLPRMDAIAKSISTLDLSSNNPKAQEAPPGHRIYSVETMAEASLHAARSHNHTWQMLRASDSQSECPCKRSDVVDLEGCFDAAMSYSGGKDNWEGDRKTALIDRDFMAVQANIVALYRPATDMDRRLLTSIVFEQKWSDLVLGEVEAMLMVSFFEQGHLLRKVRVQYATAFYRLEKHYTDCEAEKKRALDAEKKSRQALDDQARGHADDIAALQSEYERALAGLKDQMEQERTDADRKMYEAKEQIAKMSDTMKTLNAIFKQMREDSDKVRAVELKEANQKLERKCVQLEEDVKRLRPLIAQNRTLVATVESQTTQLHDAAQEIHELTVTLQEKEQIIENLLHRQEQLLVKQELMGDKVKLPSSDVASSVNPTAGDDDASSTICSRCQMSLFDDGSSGPPGAGGYPSGASAGRGNTAPTPIARRRDGKRVQCLAYRILLPNLQGRRPTKDVSWTLGCIRSILFAKQMDDNICFRIGMPVRFRMAEFVYAWFAPPEHVLVGAASDQRDLIYAQADEARWCLYYGVKLLSKESIEAKLFLSFMDEKYGDDELVFGLFCIRALDCLAGGELDWSPLRQSMSYTFFMEEWDAHFNVTGETIQVPKTVWITQHHASLATAIVLSKATADERDAFDAKMKGLGVTTLPANERPKRVVSFDHKNDGPMIDAYHWLHLMLQEYREEQAQRRAAIRLMFQTANTSTAAATTTTMPENDLGGGATTNSEMDMEQFRAMMQSLNSDVTAGMIALYFRTSYERGDGHVTFDAFMATAETLHFFTSCMRLPSPNVLATHHGRDDKDGGINAPPARLGSLVAKHFTLYEAECLLNLHASPPLTQSIAKRALEELRVVLRDGRGSSIDGFGALAAYQRLLSLQIHDRVARAETASTTITSVMLYRLDKELYSAMDCVRVDHTKRSGAEMLLESIRRKMSVYRMQRAFRARLLRDQGVPLNMRQLMHGGYGNGKTNYRDRRAIRPTKWLVAVISDLLRSKIAVDVAHPTENASHLFVEHIYDHFTQQFGSRWEAEKTIHDIFVNTRTLVGTHPRILLFSQLCGMGATGEDRYYGSAQAFHFVRMVLHCGHHHFPVLHSGGGEHIEFCRHDDAVAIIDAFFTVTGSDNKERILGRLRELERQSLKPKAADADMLLLFLLEEWRHYMLDRMNQIKVICCSDADLMSIEGYLSLDNMLVIFRRAGIAISEFEVAQVFRQVVQSNYSSLSLMDRIVKFAFPLLASEITVSPLEDVARPHYKDQIYLLLSFWEPYQESCKTVVAELQAIGAKNDVDVAMALVDKDKRRNSLSRAATVNSKLRAANITATDAAKFEEHFKALCDKMQAMANHQEIEAQVNPSDENPDADAEMWSIEVDETAKMFRRFLTECTRLRAIAKIEVGPIPDKWHGSAA
ncbi:Aste57867_11229 [Aphanomyces stellatus]|uniref:Aste57867_11229 protein n=1 Tax=Aphanomyces stellatus TaxID=120398 RepID=A0A485KSC5_9STRA|nr:hypothetical protein As57867_011187 [Aphanomyces stellatus]VFT88095.1 Aste57867_11229 [Aphanomyces stellatus]